LFWAPRKGLRLVLGIARESGQGGRLVFGIAQSPGGTGRPGVPGSVTGGPELRTYIEKSDKKITDSLKPQFMC
jgi:hypothetical protein